MNNKRQALHYGSKGWHVKNLHKNLCQLGFTIPKNKTNFDSMTEGVVKRLQELHKREPTGKVDQRTVILIQENVRRLKKLKKIGFIIPGTNPTNEETLKAFQLKHGLETNGILDRPTANLIDDYQEQIMNLKKLGFTTPKSVAEIEDVIKAFQKEHGLKPKGVLNDNTIEIIEVEAQRQNRSYGSSRLPTFKQVSLKQSESRDKTLLELYGEICNSWRMLTDVRFKLLGFVPTVSILILVNLLVKSKADEGLPLLSRFFICLIGLVVTIGLYIYEKRNTQLYDDLVSRARRIEMELGVDTGQFRGRKKPTNPFIQHDIAINLIYISAIGAWVIASISFAIKLLR